MAVLAGGGLDPSVTVTADPAPLVIGEPVDLGPFVVTIDRMRAVDELPGVSEGDDTTRVLAIVATVSATGPRTQPGSLLTEAVTVNDVPGLVTLDGSAGSDAVAADAAYVMDDGSRLDALQPGLEYDVAFVWEQESTHTAPVEATVILIGRTLRESSIDRFEAWLDPVPVMAGTVEVTEPEPAGDAEDGS